MGDQRTLTRELADLAQTLATHRHFLRHTARDLTDEQAAATPTVSALSVGGIIKHVTQVEQQWAQFVRIGAEAMGAHDDPDRLRAWMGAFAMAPGETLAGVLDDYLATAAQTDELLAALPDLDAARPLPQAPWYEPGAQWSFRRVFLHLIAETSQHAGHADIIREAIDGAKSMG